jgi:CheY-like chemotaxis protein
MISQVLLVDDDPDEIELLQEAFTIANPHIVCHGAENGLTAINFLRSGQQLPDLIMLDINMPIMDGWEVLRYIRKHEQLSHIPVIVHTTSSNDRDKKIAAELGADRFLTKYDDYARLKKEVKNIVSKPGGANP